MLPVDRKAEKNAKIHKRASQSTLDPHLTLLHPPPTRGAIKYSDAAFTQAALEWIAVTDQPLSALQHPKFREMIDIASRAEEEVIIPSQKETREAVIDLFKKNPTSIRGHLAKDIAGEVGL